MALLVCVVKDNIIQQAIINSLSKYFHQKHKNEVNLLDLQPTLRLLHYYKKFNVVLISYLRKRKKKRSSTKGSVPNVQETFFALRKRNAHIITLMNRKTSSKLENDPKRNIAETGIIIANTASCALSRIQTMTYIAPNVVYPVTTVKNASLII